jgi:hypothetical protein
MAQHESPDPKNPANQLPDVQRQTKAAEEIDKLFKGDEPLSGSVGI